MNRQFLFILIYPLLLCACNQYENKPLSGDIDLQGHRGARGLAPENTLPAFDKAIQFKMTTLELDTVLTRDNRLIITHDRRINAKICRPVGGRKARNKTVRELTVAQLKQFDCGTLKNARFPKQQPVPGTRLSTLDELFAHVRSLESKNPRLANLKYNIESKFEYNTETSPQELTATARAMIRAIKSAGLQKRVTVQSFKLEYLSVIRKLAPEIRISALFVPRNWRAKRQPDADGDAILEKTKKLGAEIVSPHYSFVSPRFVHRAHRMGIAVIPWTVNDADTIRRMLETGVDGVISDYPDVLYKVHAEFMGARK